MYKIKEEEKEIINELINKIAEDDTLSNLNEGDLHSPMYLEDPITGENFRNWLFKYKGIDVVLHDNGNGHYEYDGTLVNC